MSVPFVRFTLAVLAAASLAACSGEASACERFESLGDDPGPTASAQQQREYAEAFAACMQEEPERGSDG